MRAGSNPCSSREGGMTPLHTAARHGRLGVVQALVGGGALLPTNVSRGKDGLLCVHDCYVPLDMACIGGHSDVVRWMLSHGLGVCGRQTGGHQAFQVASFFGHVEISTLLTQEGVRDIGERLIFAPFGSCEPHQPVDHIHRSRLHGCVNHHARGREFFVGVSPHPD